ncbi:hypothetical protein CC78DRAFT_564092 [Lojkania enalia]|uniref:Uncharacterized protein n=1 Tax=Lojkania enalia TaxID=147567 RepID=A0A9P4NB53_9PLEO|nr:hypothetical protein CC78DRAFT_564092 [Didymosphaeria enalia]
MADPDAGPSSWRSSSNSSSSGSYRICSASPDSPSPTSLVRVRRMGFLKPNPDISTAISSSGWLAAATETSVRLYRVRDVDRTQKLKMDYEVMLPFPAKRERIQEVAISYSLLVILTNRRLLVYEYGPTDATRDNIFDQVIDMDGKWIPKSVEISQLSSIEPQRDATAWVAVGGQGQNGIKLFKYVFSNCWSPQEDRVTLQCPENLGSITKIAFSPGSFNRNGLSMILGVTSSNQLHCWDLRQRRERARTLKSYWVLDAHVDRDQPLNRAAITSATLFVSPLGAPIDISLTGRKKRISLDWMLPETAIGRKVVAGAVNSNGCFVFVVENDGTMRLMSIKRSLEGILSCLRRSHQWPSLLKCGMREASSISISFEEDYHGGFDVVAVNGRGHFASTHVSVPDMPKPEVLAPKALTFEAPIPEAQNIQQMPSQDAIIELYGGPQSNITADDSRATPH